MISHATQTPSPWVERFAPEVAPGARLLDLACGAGRHSVYFASRGVHVTAVDRDTEALGKLAGHPGITPLQADLEAGPWPFEAETFDALVVTRYLYRPRFVLLCDVLRPGGLLIYETFMEGNERFGKPSNPDFLLRRDELLLLTRDGFDTLAFEQGEEAEPFPAVIQRICARKRLG